MEAIRWSDNDHYLGPITYAYEKQYERFGIVLGSGDGDDYPGCRIRFSGFGHTLIVALPPVIKPHADKIVARSWDAATVARLGRDWYHDYSEREYGFMLTEGGFFQIYLGRSTNDSSTEQRWSCFLPWTQWRFNRMSYYGLGGALFWSQTYAGKNRSMATEEGNKLWEAERSAGEACPVASFVFDDFDGERITATTKIEEREWLLGEKGFKWLSWFSKPRVGRSLDLEFSSGIGQRKDSWKGGTIGHSIDLLPGELHEAAFKRYCAGHQLTFVCTQPPHIEG